MTLFLEKKIETNLRSRTDNFNIVPYLNGKYALRFENLFERGTKGTVHPNLSMRAFPIAIKRVLSYISSKLVSHFSSGWEDFKVLTDASKLRSMKVKFPRLVWT